MLQISHIQKICSRWVWKGNKYMTKTLLIKVQLLSWVAKGTISSFTMIIFKSYSTESDNYLCRLEMVTSTDIYCVNPVSYCFSNITMYFGYITGFLGKFRALDNRYCSCSKIIIWHSNSMLWVLKRIVSGRRAGIKFTASWSLTFSFCHNFQQKLTL